MRAVQNVLDLGHVTAVVKQLDFRSVCVEGVVVVGQTVHRIAEIGTFLHTHVPEGIEIIIIILTEVISIGRFGEAGLPE